MPSTPLDKGSTMCRYFLSGRCTNGRACKYEHGTEGIIRVLENNVRLNAHFQVIQWVTQPGWIVGLNLGLSLPA